MTHQVHKSTECSCCGQRRRRAVVTIKADGQAITLCAEGLRRIVDDFKKPRIGAQAHGRARV